MPLLGSAAMLLAFDVAADAIAEHDHWHTYEHLPERLGIPGFLRGTRWVAMRGQPRYLVLYEVADLGVLTSAAYRARLDSPTSWTSRMMPRYRGMRRGFCAVTGSTGFGTGRVARVWRFKPAPASEARLREWLAGDLLPRLPSQPGLCAAHLLESVLSSEMTAEQRLRGADGAMDWALVVAGYRESALADLEAQGLTAAALAAHGAAAAVEGQYVLDCSLTHAEVTRANAASAARGAPDR